MHHTPILFWIIFIGIVLSLLALDLGLFHKEKKLPFPKDNRTSIRASSNNTVAHESKDFRKSILLSGFYIAMALAFGAWIAYVKGYSDGMDYLTGYCVEKSLSFDNIFIMSLIFSAFKVDTRHQHRVLFWGILGVIVFRGLLIGAGIEIVLAFSWMLYIFGVFLIATGFQILFSNTEQKDITQSRIYTLLQKHVPLTQKFHGHHFWVKENKKWRATPLFAALIMIEGADLVFAIDSVPAVIAITTDPFIVYTSNVFAILGLRSLYMALAILIDRFSYLKYALALILIFVGCKIFAAELGFKLPSVGSLCIILGILLWGIAYSFMRTKKENTVI